MDQPWLFAVGVIVVVAALADLALTTVRVGDRRGPVTAAVTRVVWRTALVGDPGHQRRSVAGVAVTLSVLVVWVALLLLGFACMFLSETDAVIDSSSGSPASALGRFAYAAGGLAGAGASLLAGGAGWQLVNNISALVGLTVAALAVTFVLQVVSSVTGERAMAANVAALGTTPADAVATGLRADADTFRNQLTSIANQLSFAAESHLAFPMLEFFHSTDPVTSVAVAVARYDEMVLLMHHAAPDENETTVRVGRAAVDRFLKTSKSSRAAGASAIEAPPLPALAALTEVADVTDLENRLSSESERRSRLLALVQHAGWTWQDVEGARMDGTSRTASNRP